MASLKKCIADKCKQCTYDPQGQGTWREQVEACTVTSCPLWIVRPISTATTTLNRKVQDDGLDIDSILANLKDDTEKV